MIPSNSPAFPSEENTELLFLPAGPNVIICEADKHTNAHDFELWRVAGQAVFNTTTPLLRAEETGAAFLGGLLPKLPWESMY